MKSEFMGTNMQYCTLIENMRNMPRSHIHIKPTCLYTEHSKVTDKHSNEQTPEKEMLRKNVGSRFQIQQRKTEVRV